METHEGVISGTTVCGRRSCTLWAAGLQSGSFKLLSRAQEWWHLSHLAIPLLPSPAYKPKLSLLFWNSEICLLVNAYLFPCLGELGVGYWPFRLAGGLSPSWVLPVGSPLAKGNFFPMSCYFFSNSTSPILFCHKNFLKHLFHFDVMITQWRLRVD